MTTRELIERLEEIEEETGSQCWVETHVTGLVTGARIVSVPGSFLREEQDIVVLDTVYAATGRKVAS